MWSIKHTLTLCLLAALMLAGTVKAQNETATFVAFDRAFQFDYPADWILNDLGYRVFVTASAETLSNEAIPSGEAALLVAYVGEDESYVLGDIDFMTVDAATVASMVLSAFGMNETRKEIVLPPQNTFAGIRATGSNDLAEAQVTTYSIETGQFLIFIGLAAVGEFEQWAPVFELANTTFAAGDAVTAERIIAEDDLLVDTPITTTLAADEDTTTFFYFGRRDEVTRFRISGDAFGVGIRVYDDTGRFLVGKDVGSDASELQVIAPLPYTSFYYVDVLRSFSGALNYTLEATVVGEAVGGGVIDYGETLPGFIFSDSFELWMFEGTAGDQIRIAVDGAFNTSAELTLSDGENTTIAESATASSDALIEVTLPENGLYRIRVLATDSTSSGDYTIMLSKTN